ncbi:hypothetical protein [Curtobacterium ammoniigenes]|uniref:hypothetical protein n=1 Tax=Curtobacterium ammoniigenes TaxID=395387 RepID=UPI00083449ED|nr:hypothetical protein [Curtobacterium ammoniigenes]
MPRDVTLLCRGQVDARQVAEALVEHNTAWGIRALDDGSILQVCRDADRPVITVLGVHRVDFSDEIERILPDAPAMPVPVWWADTVTPFDDDGEDGVAAALDAAVTLNALCIVHGD